MSRLNWVERLDGWRSDGYRIEFAGPRLWIVSSADPAQEDQAVATESIEATAGSLSAAKRTAERIEARKIQDRRLRNHLTLLLLLAVPLVGSGVAPGPWTLPVFVVVIPLVIRSLVIVVDTFTERSYERINQTYQ